MKPASASPASARALTVSGLASSVTSAPGAMPMRSRRPSRARASSPGASIVGVPPPKNTVEAGRGPIPTSSRTRAAREASARTEPA